MADDPPVLLPDSGQEAGHVLQHDQRDVEGVTESDEAGTLVRRIDIQHPGQDRRLIGHYPHGVPPEMGEAHDEVPGPIQDRVQVREDHDRRQVGSTDLDVRHLAAGLAVAVRIVDHRPLGVAARHVTPLLVLDL